MPFEYTKFFSATGAETVATPPSTSVDRRDGEVYEFVPKVELAVNVALATGRPLLVVGEPGSGKSSLAPSVARRLKWRYYEDVVSSRTQARDLLWRFDALRRLNDAQLRDTALKPDEAYVVPGVVWWAFDRAGALARARAYAGPAPADTLLEQHGELNATRDPDRAVVLVDEIDKADPDVPNDLLVPLGSLQFEVVETREAVRAANAPLIVVTSNRERELPPAFVRRCILLEMPRVDAPWLVRIGKAHYGPEHGELYQQLATQVQRLADQARALGRRPPSSPEFLDAVAACLKTGVAPGSDQWADVQALTLEKPLGTGSGA